MKQIIFIFFIGLTSACASVSSTTNGWLNVLEHGGNNKGELCTEAIQGAIDKAASQGGGTIYFPAANI